LIKQIIKLIIKYVNIPYQMHFNLNNF
jgi:hypothetical protein